MSMETKMEELFLSLVNHWPGSKRRHQTTMRYEQKQKTDLQRKKVLKKKTAMF